MACASRSGIVRRLLFYQGAALLFAPAPQAIVALRASIPTQFVIGSGQHCFRTPRPCRSATSALTLRSRGRPKGYAFCPPLTSNVRALISRVQRQRSRTTVQTPRPLSVQHKCNSFKRNHHPHRPTSFGQPMNCASRSLKSRSVACASRTLFSQSMACASRS
jgi:hypothetical protein